MGQAATRDRFSRALASFFPLTALSLCAAACNTCVFGALNSPGTTVTVKVGNPPPACNVTTTNGAVHIEIGAATGTTSPEPSVFRLTSPQITHLYVTLAGVDAHPSLDADDRSPDWQPLAPQLKSPPFQVDLLAPRDAEAAFGPLEQASVPAGVYRQIRLRLATPPASQQVLLDVNENRLVPQTNSCGASVVHCAVTSDGQIRPLAFASEAVLRIPPESMDGRWLHVLPGSEVMLRIELDRDLSFLWPSGEAFRLIPEFHVSAQPFLPGAQN